MSFASLEDTSHDLVSLSVAWKVPALGGILALHAHCALLLDYVPPEEPLGTPLGNTLRIRRPKLEWRGP